MVLIGWIIIIVALTVMDQVTKLMAANLLTDGKSFDVISGVLRFTYVENRGAAFGMFSEHRWVFMTLSVVAIVALLIYLWKFRTDSKLACLAMSMIIAGGIGNMIDRVVLGYVIDFLDFCAFPKIWPWVFNVADVCVCVGGGLLVLWLILSIISDYKKEKAEKSADSSAQNNNTK